MTRYHCPPDVVKPIRVTDDEAYPYAGSKHFFNDWARARLAAQCNADRMVKEARAQLDRARSLKAVADALPVEEPAP